VPRVCKLERKFSRHHLERSRGALSRGAMEGLTARQDRIKEDLLRSVTAGRSVFLQSGTGTGKTEILLHVLDAVQPVAPARVAYLTRTHAQVQNVYERARKVREMCSSDPPECDSRYGIYVRAAKDKLCHFATVRNADDSSAACRPRRNSPRGCEFYSKRVEGLASPKDLHTRTVAVAQVRVRFRTAQQGGSTVREAFFVGLEPLVPKGYAPEMSFAFDGEDRRR